MSSSGFSSKSDDHQQTPTSRKSLSSTARPRSLPLDKSGGRATPTDKSSSKSQVRTRKDTPTGSQPAGKMSEYKKNSRLSTPNLSKVRVISPEPRRSSAGSNLSKSKSNSMNSLLVDDNEEELTPRGTNRRPRSKWSTSKMTSFASVPNLLNPDDTGKLSLSSSHDSDLSDFSRPDINDNIVSEKKVRKSAGGKSPSVGQSIDSTLKSSKRAASTGRLTAELNKSNYSDDRKGLNKRAASSVTNLKNVGNQRTKDRDLMPPPAVTNVAKIKQETRFMKRAQQQRRKTTGTSELTFEEAKSILQGNSGILSGKNGKVTKEKRSSSTSPSREKTSRNSVDSGFKSGVDIGEITDSALLTAATEIEMTAAEIRRKSAPSSSMSSNLEASPHDLPERDIPPERDSNRTCSKSLNSAKLISVKPHSIKDMDSDRHSAASSDSPRGSISSLQDDDEYPSPSVKERIARLNKHVAEPADRQGHSPSRGQFRSESPVPGSPRRTTSVHISFPSPSTKSTSTSQSVPAQVLSESSGLETMTTSSSVSPRLSASGSVDSFQPHSQPLRDHMQQPHHSVGTSHLSLASAMTTSAQSLSPPSGLTSSLDSEGLSHHLSPGNHSNTSPRSVADTGLGSDTDLENRYVYCYRYLSILLSLPIT